MNQQFPEKSRELANNFFYHSGFPQEASQLSRIVETQAFKAAASEPSTRIVFKTRKYPPPFQIGITTEADWNAIAPMSWHHDGFWHIDLVGIPYGRAFEFKIRLGNIWMAGGNARVEEGVDEFILNDDFVFLAHTIEVYTHQWRPNHLVTLRTLVDGWNRDVYGRFHTPESPDGTGTWYFQLDRSRFRESSMEVAFFLDRRHPSSQGSLLISFDEHITRLGDNELRFDVLPHAYVHGYDNLVAEESLWEQRIVPPSTRPDPQKVYDVIVVGSGIAGGTLADALSDKGLETLVLEAGGLGYPIHMNGFPRSQNNPVGRDELDSFFRRDSEFVGGLIFNLGGRSNYWSGIIPEMQEWEFSLGPWPEAVRDDLSRSVKGPQSGYAEANALMKKQVSMGPYQELVMDLLKKELDDDYHIEILPRSMHQPELTELGTLQNILRRSNGAYSTSDLLLDSLGFNVEAGEKYLDLALHHLTTKVEPDGDQVVAHCQDLIGNCSRSYRGRHLVMCCGSVESPRLAIQSGLLDPQNKMGRGLTDHAAYSYKHAPRLPTTGPLKWLGDVNGHAKIMIRPADPYSMPFNIELLINDAYWDVRHADKDLWERVRPNEATVGIKFIFASPLDEENVISPQGEGRKPYIHVKPNQYGEQYFAQMIEARNAIFSALGVPASELSVAWDHDEWWVGNKGSVQHSGGSMRMCDQGTGVVDQNLTLLAYDNIHCCDASVFPSIPAANPSLTIAALALRLAKHLKYLCHDVENE